MSNSCNDSQYDENFNSQLSIESYQCGSATRACTTEAADESPVPCMAGRSSDQSERNKASTESKQCGSATRACTTELTIENILKCQEENNDFKLLSDWKNLGVKPTWNEISEYSPEVKYYRAPL